MINREMRPAAVLTYGDSVDEYGQINAGVPTERMIEITLRLYQHTKVEDIRFNEVTHSALTVDKTITDANKIRVDNAIYSIEFVNPEGRLTQVFLKRE